MGIFDKYLRAHKVEELPSTNIDKQAIYIVSDDKSDTFMIAVRDIDNTYWRVLKELPLGTTENTAAAGNHTHSQLHTHSNKSTLDGITPTKVLEWDSKAEGDHTHELSDINELDNALDSKVDKVAGKELSDNNFSTQEKNKLASLENYDDSSILSQLEDKVDKVAGKGLSDENYTLAEKNKLAGLENFDDSDIQTELDTKVDKVVGKGLSDENYTLSEKDKLGGIEDEATKNATDAQLRGRATHTGVQPISSVSNLQSSLDSKVDKEAGMGLSSNDFTTAEKQKLAGLEEPNYRGTFATEASMQDLTDPKPGNYALLDLGVGEDVVPYFYDGTDGTWVPGGGSTELTPAQLKSLYESNPDTNAFTDTEKTKLSGIAPQATKNDTDANLLDRANHTGSQEMSTITGLSGALDSKEPKIATKNTAFNKNFGTTSTTVARGNHTHSELHTHNNQTVLDGITSTKVSGWDDIVDLIIADKLMFSGFENADFASTASPDAFILARNPDKTVGLIPLSNIIIDTSELLNRDFTNPKYAIHDDPADHPYFLMGGDGKGVAVVSPEQAKEQLNISLQHLIDDSIADHSDGDLELDFTGTGYAYFLFPSGAVIEDDGGSLSIISDDTFLMGSKGSLALNPTGNFFADMDPSPKGIQYKNDYSATYTNRSLVDKGYVDKAISDIPNTNNNNKWFIGSNANPLDTPTIAIDTQDLMQGHEIVITYKRDGQVELPLIESSRPDVKINLQSINNSVNFEGGGAAHRIYLHLTEVVGGDTYCFDITVGKIDTYTNV